MRIEDVSGLGLAAQRQILEKLGQQVHPEKKSKYNAQPDARGKIKFDSKKEAGRYDELMILLRAGKISDLKLQPQFTLQESYVTPDGIRVRAIRYVADFCYTDASGVTVVEDVKSKATKTRVYKIKKKLMLERFGITIKEIE